MPKEKNLKGKDIESEVQSVRNLFCTNLKRLREDVVLSQNMLAKKAGLTANFINDLENGKKGASYKTITKLCMVLRVEPFQLFMPLNYHGNEFQFAVIENLRNKMEKELDKLMEYYKLKD